MTDAGKEHACLKRFFAGDNDALSDIFNIYIDTLFLYGMKIVPDEDLVKDAIQDVFISLFEKQRLIRINSTSNLKGYLFKSLRNKILEELRSKHRKNVVKEMIFKSEPHFVEDIELKIISSEENKEKYKILLFAMRDLTSRQKEAVFLKFSDGFNYKQIAEIMEISVASARTLIYRSLKQIRMSILNRAW